MQSDQSNDEIEETSKSAPTSSIKEAVQKLEDIIEEKGIQLMLVFNRSYWLCLEA